MGARGRFILLTPIASPGSGQRLLEMPPLGMSGETSWCPGHKTAVLEAAGNAGGQFWGGVIGGSNGWKHIFSPLC